MRAGEKNCLRGGGGNGFAAKVGGGDRGLKRGVGDIEKISAAENWARESGSLIGIVIGSVGDEWIGCGGEGWRYDRGGGK